MVVDLHTHTHTQSVVVDTYYTSCLTQRVRELVWAKELAQQFRVVLTCPRRRKGTRLVTKGVNCLVHKFAGFPMKFEKLPIWWCTITGSRQNFETCSFKTTYTAPHKWVELITSDRGTGKLTYGNFRSERMPRTMNTSIWLANWGLGSSLKQDCSYSKSWLLISPMFMKPINSPECLSYTKSSLTLTSSKTRQTCLLKSAMESSFASLWSCRSTSLSGLWWNAYNPSACDQMGEQWHPMTSMPYKWRITLA